jgi:hypothetical protein
VRDDGGGSGDSSVVDASVQDNRGLPNNGAQSPGGMSKLNFKGAPRLAQWQYLIDFSHSGLQSESPGGRSNLNLKISGIVFRLIRNVE